MSSTIGKLVLAGACALLAGRHGCAAADPGSQPVPGTQVSDARRETQILARFNTDSQLRDYDLTIIVDGDRAALGGNVGSEAAKSLAGRIAADVSGVTHVDNRIGVDAHGSRRLRNGGTPRLDAALTDGAIGAAVKSRLRWNAHTEGLDIRVDSSGGTVTLAGSAISYAERDMAGIVARNTEGVVHVDNELVLASLPRPSAAEDGGESPTDAWITSRVKGSLLLTRGVSRSGIAVTTSNGVVSLRGTVVGKAERELATQVAREVRGVKQVDARGLEVG